MTIELSKEQVSALLNYIYRLERFAENEGYDKGYTDEINRAIEKLQFTQQ